MNKHTQMSLVLEYCAIHGSITAIEAFTQLNINSPRKCISNIRKSGFYKVDESIESRIDQNGIHKRWKRYFITPVERDENGN